MDDREENLLAYEVSLRDLDCKVVTVTSGRKALKHVETSEFAVVLLDVQMPDLDGFETARLVRDLPNGKLLPIIFVTAGMHDAATFKKAHASGAIDFLSKPIDTDVLTAKVQLFIELFQSRQIIKSQMQSRAFLNGEGELPKLFRQKDWSESALGPLDTWPQSLRTAVSIILQSRFPMFLSWGPSRALLYNDAYAEILGKKHPAALGEKFEVVWKEIWPDIVPLVNAVDRGESVYLEDLKLVMNRFGYEEDTYFTFSYSPITGEAGSVQGLFCSVIETTKRKAAENELKKALDDVARSERTLDQIFNESPAFMSLVRGPNHVFARVNRKYYEITGRSNILGKTVAEVFPEIEQQGFIDILNEVYRTGQPYHGYEMPIILNKEKTGLTEVYFDFVYQPMLDPSGEIYGIIGQGTDVTHQVLARRKAEESDRDLRLALESARMGTWRIDVKTNEIAVSPQLAELLGYTPELHDIRNLVRDTIYVEDREATHSKLKHAVENRTSYVNEYRAIAKDGSMRWFSSRGNVIYSSKGEPVSISGVTVEVTDRKAAELALERNARLVESMPQPFFAVDGDWKINYWNPAASETIGMEVSEVLGRNMWDVFPGLKTSPFGDSYRKALSEKIPQSVEDYYPDFDKWFETTAFPFDSGVAVAFIDITDRKRAEQVMAEARREAERASELKSAFLANMSHEIRTPLGAMIGFADLLKDPSLEESERWGYIDIITRNGHQLAHLINDILDLSKVESGHLSFESRPTNPLRLVSEVVSLLNISAKEKNLHLRVLPEGNLPEEIYTDPARLKQILVNIVGNALKFTQVGSVVVRIFSSVDSVTQALMLHFEVKDTGIGIPEEKRARLFQVFSQADESITRKYGGTGLGLALSKKLANGLGGDVVLQSSAEGGGSTFLITVRDQDLTVDAPKKITPKQLHISELENADHLSKLHILLVEDSPDNQQLIWRILMKKGAKIEIADNGMEGVSMALRGNYDLILMDIQMPLMDGYTATMRLREHGYMKPIIALTAHAMSEVRQKCLQVGCTDHLPKPINAIDLVSVISKHAKNLAVE